MTNISWALEMNDALTAVVYVKLMNQSSGPSTPLKRAMAKSQYSFFVESRVISCKTGTHPKESSTKKPVKSSLTKRSDKEDMCPRSCLEYAANVDPHSVLIANDTPPTARSLIEGRLQRRNGRESVCKLSNHIIIA